MMHDVYLVSLCTTWHMSGHKTVRNTCSLIATRAGGQELAMTMSLVGLTDTSTTLPCSSDQTICRM